MGTSAKEVAMQDKLKQELQAVEAEVKDVSGGCGSFFKVRVVSPVFEGKTAVQRNRLVHSALQQDFKDVHGFNVECSTPAAAVKN